MQDNILREYSLSYIQTVKFKSLQFRKEQGTVNKGARSQTCSETMFGNIRSNGHYIQIYTQPGYLPRATTLMTS